MCVQISHAKVVYSLDRNTLSSDECDGCESVGMAGPVWTEAHPVPKAKYHY